MWRIDKIRKATAFFIVFLFLTTPVAAAGKVSNKEVIIGGMPFGVSFSTGELKIGGFDEVKTENGVCSPAKDAGLLENDIIVKVNGKEIKNALDITVAVKMSEGKEIQFDVIRDEENITVNVSPALSGETGDWRVGLLIEDGAAGLGTVTYIEEDTGRFGGLGHGILKGETSELCELEKGTVTEVTVSGVEKGTKGKPGELKGEFHSEKLGVVTANTEVGVFGYITERAQCFQGEKMALGNSENVKNGGATVYCTVDGGGVCEYGVEISRIEGSGEGSKNFFVTVTDMSLIEKTGGIVRGMSGSPVVQNGKLIGAVTHVLVDDPTRGYGIFIENMMDASGN